MTISVDEMPAFLQASCHAGQWRLSIEQLLVSECGLHRHRRKNRKLLFPISRLQ